MYSICSYNSEEYASELLENLESTDSNVISIVSNQMLQNRKIFLSPTEKQNNTIMSSLIKQIDN